MQFSGSLSCGAWNQQGFQWTRQLFFCHLREQKVQSNRRRFTNHGRRAHHRSRLACGRHGLPHSRRWAHNRRASPKAAVNFPSTDYEWLKTAFAVIGLHFSSIRRPRPRSPEFAVR